MKIKQEHIDKLSQGKKSWARIGGRKTPHHLYQYEKIKYDRAMKNKYLEVTSKERINLLNLWEKVCAVKSWKNYILIKDEESWTAEIFLWAERIEAWETQAIKQYIKELVA